MKKPTIGEAAAKMTPASNMKELFTVFSKLIKLPDYYSKTAVKFSTKDGKPTAFEDKPTMRDKLTVGVNYNGQLPVTEQLRTSIKDGVYQLGKTVYLVRGWHDSKENYTGIDISVVKINKIK